MSHPHQLNFHSLFEVYMNLTMVNKIKLCLEILTAKSGHKHKAQEKMLSTFQRGYAAGVNDERLSNKE